MRSPQTPQEREQEPGRQAGRPSPLSSRAALREPHLVEVGTASRAGDAVSTPSSVLPPTATAAGGEGKNRGLTAAWVDTEAKGPRIQTPSSRTGAGTEGRRLLHRGALQCTCEKPSPNSLQHFQQGWSSRTGGRPAARRAVPSGALPARPTGSPTLPAHAADARRQPTRHHLLIVVVETVRWLLVLSVHPALFAVTNNSTSSASFTVITQADAGLK